MIYQKKTIKAFTLFIVCLSTVLFFSCKKNVSQPASNAAFTEFVKFTVDNVDTVFTLPTDSIVYRPNGNTENSTFNQGISITAIHRNGTDSNYVLLAFRSEGIALGASQPLQMLLHTNYQLFFPSSPANVDITEYGNVGDYIAGNCNGPFTDMSGNSHIVSISFRVRRLQ